MTYRFRSAILALSVAALAGCSYDQATAAPSRFDASEQQASASKSEAPKTQAKPLHRATKLEREISVTKIIGLKGGTISIPDAGVTLTVPAGAVLLPVPITMTALSGDAIAYEFAPHGLIFLKPVTISQHLADTKEKGKGGATTSAPVEMGYFGLLSQVTSLVDELEDMRGGIESNGVFTSTIWHFSGYAIACGRH